MLKSHLIRRISSQNPHLYERDVEKVVNAMLDQIIVAFGAGRSSGAAGFRRVFNEASQSADGPQSSYWSCRLGPTESQALLQGCKRNASAT